MLPPSDVKAAAAAVRNADALVIAAGAGMGVDSGLPDFRGNQGFWKAYPPYEKLGLEFTALANPVWYKKDPTLAWGFYGHRMNLYRATEPHAGFGILRRWAGNTKHGAFAFTSNVDGHFQKAGFPEERVTEVHGSIHHLQCINACGIGIFPTGNMTVSVDETTMRAREPLPKCPACAGDIRYNILMFGDWDWEDGRTTEQQNRMVRWLDAVGTGRIVVLEFGAGLAIPTVRRFSERLAEAGAQLVRCNPREPDVPAGGIGLPVGALEGIRAIDAALNASAE